MADLMLSLGPRVNIVVVVIIINIILSSGRRARSNARRRLADYMQRVV
jgi:hypothetical protein